MKKLLDCIEYIKAKEIVEILIAVGVLVGFIILSSIFAKIIMIKIVPLKRLIVLINNLIL